MEHFLPWIFRNRFFICRPPADDIECLQCGSRGRARKLLRKIEALVNRCGTRSLNSLGIMLCDRFSIVVISLCKSSRTGAWENKRRAFVRIFQRNFWSKITTVISRSKRRLIIFVAVRYYPCANGQMHLHPE